MRGCPESLAILKSVAGAQLAEAARVSYWSQAARSAVYKEWLARHAGEARVHSAQ